MPKGFIYIKSWLESGSAPRFLPVKRRFFVVCFFVLATVSKCWFSLNKYIKVYGLVLLSIESVVR